MLKRLSMGQVPCGLLVDPWKLGVPESLTFRFQMEELLKAAFEETAREFLEQEAPSLADHQQP